MHAEIAKDLESWKATFKKDLSAHLETLRTDEDIYGFAIAAPEDLGNLTICSAIGRESKLSGEKHGSDYWLERRYSATDWEFLPNAVAFNGSCDELQEIDSKHGHVFFSDTTEYTPQGIEFRDSLYSACLDVMAECDSEGAFGDIWFKILCLSSDGQHPIVRKSFNRLNKGRARTEASLLYNGRGLLGSIMHSFKIVTDFVRRQYARHVRRRMMKK